MPIRQMTAETLNALKGYPNLASIDFSTSFAASIPAQDLPVAPGSVVSLNAAGQYILGVGNTRVMPMFTFSGSDDPDVLNFGGDPYTEKNVWVAAGPTGQCTALVACGSFELVSTSFVANLSYPPNTPLTANLSGAAAPGQLRPGTMYTNMIVGIVSRGVVDNGYGHNAVAFWAFPVFPTA